MIRLPTFASAIGEAAAALIALLMGFVSIVPAAAGELPHAPTEPHRYIVRYGASLGAFEPIAGEIQCIVGEECTIPLSMWPKVELHLRSDAKRPSMGTATIDCPTINCAFFDGMASTDYGNPFNQLTIYERTDERDGVYTLLVLRRTNPLGRFDFVISP